MAGIDWLGMGRNYSDRPLSRRCFAMRLVRWSVAAGAVHTDLGQFLVAQSGAAGPNGGPLITSLDLSLVNEWLTPNELFFIREHFPAPRLSVEDWTVSVAGAVERPLKIRYGELLQRPRVDLPVVLECAGNPVGGGMLGNAEWSGARLGALLQEAGPHAEAKFARLSGADGEPGGATPYSRSIPLEKALHADTLLAYGMNGEVLPRHHGFPVRAIVPGWYGMDSVKWLRKIEVLTEPDRSPLMTERYLREVRQSDGSFAAQSLTGMRVKSAFSRPLDGAVLFGRRLPLRGIAWAGEGSVRAVEVSTDGGAGWNSAEITGDKSAAVRPYAWVQWRFDWSVPGAGTYELAVRATDDRGDTQPAARPTDRRDVHELNHYERVKCTVV